MKTSNKIGGINVQNIYNVNVISALVVVGKKIAHVITELNGMVMCIPCDTGTPFSS